MAAHPFFAEWRLISDSGDMRLIVRRSRPARQSADHGALQRRALSAARLA